MEFLYLLKIPGDLIMKKTSKANTDWKSRILVYIGLLDYVRFHVWLLRDSQTYMTANKTHADFFKREKEEFVRRSLYDIWQKEEAEKQIEENQEVISQKRQIDSEECIKDGKGESRSLFISKIPILDDKDQVKYIICYAEDMTELKETGKALRESKDKFEIFTEKAPLGIFVIDYAGRYLEVNQAAAQLSGYSKEELLDLSIQEFTAPEFMAKGMAMFEELKAKGYSEVDVIAIKKSGERIWLNIVAVRVDNNKVISFCKDITEQKKADQKIIYLSFHDILTGLYNRAFLEQEMQRLNTKRQLPMGIIMADLNYLKQLNDNYGHKQGDEALKKASEVLRSSCRKEDIVARYGGDEFVIFLPQATEDDLKMICGRIFSRCKEIFIKGKPLSLALGAASKKNMNKELDKVLKEAEDKMYECKRLKKTKS
jgi:diguanylate cyclase (GGDEF)-like protein/PAS domain S-box-containing protein